MSQVNVNPPRTEPTTSGDRTAAAGVNLITVLVVLAVLAVLAWFLFTGPLQTLGSGTTNVNVNPPSQQVNPSNPQPPNVNVNPPYQQQPGTGTGTQGGTTKP